ncbi:MAG TPA: hypothetical protein VMU01_01515 [Rhizomicrobium sp.]|nr:hypothetical protein [Rhizomicrobium sp.]
MHISLIIAVLIFLMLVGALWVPNRDAAPIVRRSQFSLAILGLVGLNYLAKDVVVTVAFDLPHLAGVASVVTVLVAIIVPAFRHASLRTKVPT